MNVPFVDLKSLHRGLAVELQQAWRQVEDEGQYILGPQVDAFEDEFARYCGARYCVGVGNGLDALTLTLRAMGVVPGDEVIVPGTTYIATWLAVSHVGAIPVPVEPDPGTFNIDPARIEEAITSRTSVILPVDLYGQLADRESVLRISRRHWLKVLEDAAQAHGARSGGVSAGAWADAAAFSFFPTKNLGCLGDGGAMVTNNQELADKVRLLRNYGSVRKYYNDILGFNSRLDPLQAAFLRVKLRQLDRWNAHRREVASAYEAGLADLPELTLPSHTGGEGCHVWHLYVIHHPRRDALQLELRAAGVETLIHYPVPPHLSEAYSPLGLAGRLPISERLAAEALSLPIGPHMGPNQVAQVISAVRRFCLGEPQRRSLPEGRSSHGVHMEEQQHGSVDETTEPYRDHLRLTRASGN
ncbi:MAG: DegT/DnrJ/EryC1/StrS family aminotransferase [Candidatus Binataceae bacterium]